jgi:hypothetical protein
VDLRLKEEMVRQDIEMQSGWIVLGGQQVRVIRTVEDARRLLGDGETADVYEWFVGIPDVKQ